MKPPENFNHENYHEIFNKLAHPLLQFAATSSLVCKEKNYGPIFYVNPQNPTDQEMQAWLWLDNPGLPDGGKWAEIRVGKYVFGKGRDASDSIIVEVPLGNLKTEDEIYNFIDELNEAWHRKLDQARSGPTWRVLSNASGYDDGTINIGIAEPDNKEKEICLSLICEYQFEKKYLPRNYDGLSQEQFVQLILTRISEVNGTVSDCVNEFEQKILPKLIKDRAEKASRKPAGWLKNAFIKSDLKEVGGQWLEAQDGTEPREYKAYGILKAGKYDYVVLAASIDHDDPKWPGRFDLDIFFPVQVAEILARKNWEKSLEIYRNFMKNRNLDLGIHAGKIFDSELVLKFTHTVFETESNKEIFGLSCNIDELDLKKILEANISREQIIVAMVNTLMEIHPHIDAYVKSQSS